MRNHAKAAFVAIACALACSPAWPQQAPQHPANLPGQNRKHRARHERTLNSDDRLAVIASALDSKKYRRAEGDCSHLVHSIYERAGFRYAYATSDDLYDGVEGFQRVSDPQPGDLVVWHGHVGIVIRPSRHVFFSFLHAGPGIDDYRSRYWNARGEARFYHYLKDVACAGCTVARSGSSEE